MCYLMHSSYFEKDQALLRLVEHLKQDIESTDGHMGSTTTTATVVADGFPNVFLFHGVCPRSH